MRIKLLALVVASVTLTGCWHVTVTSGRAPAPTVVEKPFQNSFVFGLVPPPEMNTRAACPNGVSKVETQHSFINGLVSAITFSLYTPINVKVTCAAR